MFISPVCPVVYILMFLYVHVSVHLFLLSDCFSLFPSFYLSVCLSLLSVCLFVFYVSVYLSLVFAHLFLLSVCSFPPSSLLACLSLSSISVCILMCLSVNLTCLFVCLSCLFFCRSLHLPTVRLLCSYLSVSLSHLSVRLFISSICPSLYFTNLSVSLSLLSVSLFIYLLPPYLSAQGAESVQLTSVYLLVQSASENILIFFYKTSYIKKEVNCTGASPSLRVPW